MKTNLQTAPSRQAGLSMVEIMIATGILAAIIAATFAILTKASSHAESTQITLKMETDAREALDQIIKDLRESRLSLLQVGSATQLKAGTATSPIVADGLPVVGIQFRLPGLKTDLKAYTAGSDQIFTRKVSYYWESDPRDPRDGKDNDNNGVIDEGVLVKREVTVDGTGAELPVGSPKVTITRICSSVRLSTHIPATPQFIMYEDASKIQLLPGLQFFAPAGTTNTITVKLRLEKGDPRDPKKYPVLMKLVESSVDLRN